MSVWYQFPEESPFEGALTVWIHSEAPSCPPWTSLPQRISGSVNELWKLIVREVNMHWETNSTWCTVSHFKRPVTTKANLLKLESHCKWELWIQRTHCQSIWTTTNKSESTASALSRQLDKFPSKAIQGRPFICKEECNKIDHCIKNHVQSDSHSCRV